MRFVDGTELSHWSTRELAKYLKRTEGISVSWHYIARIWREEHLKPHRNGTFKISKAPTFAEKVADVISLYLAPPGGAVVLSIDEKTQIQATSEKRTADYVRHGTTNLFAALNVTAGEVIGECKPTRNGKDFLAFLKKASDRTPRRTSMSSWTTSRRTPPRRSRSGWPRTRTSTSISLPSGPRG
ncbi:hypothetical protein ACIQM0_21045 [Streptomyces sp. NPDC091387]|uniref:hypothetical protein n=1 Tax=Streptomyces sp. NPDC091387 TaxID=3365998 RepID=UPI00381489AF